ncbi:SAF domain-containing protein [Pseudonocardia sp.]|uniref:SAF domain-containing protein n=1 Tax=Pseudonocardia sp. TaxID=60912 RepID=UPI002605E08D|nr:SAF domain-containing protein [Pseudonocardia sp.]
MGSRLSPLLHHRLREVAGAPGWRRTALLRRTAAGLLAALALALALAPQAAAGSVPVVVAATDLGSGSLVTAEALAVREWPPELAPAGALTTTAAAEGRVVVGAVRAGEPLTDVRLTGAGPLASGSAAVPVRLADADVAALLVAGRRVDVVTLGERADQPVVLATDAEVLAVLPGPSGSQGPLVLVALSREVATRVAAATLSAQVAVTLR